MKNIFLFLLTFVALHCQAQISYTTTFDFTKPTELNPSVTPEPFNGGYVVVRETTFTSGDVSLYCGGESVNTTVDIYTSQNKSTGEFNYFMEIWRLAFITISVPDGYSISKITLTGSLGALNATPGVLNSQGEWLPSSSSVSSVKFASYGQDLPSIEKVIVEYLAPSAILQPSVVTYTDKDGKISAFTNDMKLKSFKSLNLQFGRLTMSVLNTAGVSMVQTDNENKPVAVTAGATDSIVKIAVATPITTDGSYSITVTEGTFTDGTFQNVALPAYKFTVEEDRATMDKGPVKPEEGDVETLPDAVAVDFSIPIKLNKEITTVQLYKDGEYYMDCPISISTLSQKTLLITSNANENAKGVYVFKVLEGTVHNTAYGTANEDKNDRWNPAFDLFFFVVGPIDPLSDLKKEAADLEELIDKVGYPVAGSDGATQIVDVTKADAHPTKEELEAAIKAFLEETNVTLPTKDQWFFIVGVNNNTPQDSLYLKFEDEGAKIAVTYSKKDAAAFKVVNVNATDKTIVLGTKDGKFLHVPHTLPNYEVDGLTLTDEQIDINTLTLHKFWLEGKTNEMFGTFTIFGGLGKKGSNDKFAYLLYQYDSAKILTDPDLTVADLMFTVPKSNAFVFVETTEPESEVGKVTPEVKLTPTTLDYAGNTMTLSVLRVKSATLKADESPYIMKNGEIVAFTGSILNKLEDSATDFRVNTMGLAAGDYDLMLPAGTFTFEAPEEGKSVKDIDMMASFTVVKGSEGQVYPEAVLSTRSLKAGEAMTLTILNVKSVTLKNASLVRFELDGNPISFSGTILTQITDSTFSVNTVGLDKGSYTLVMPMGTFAYVAKDEKMVVDKFMSSDFTITYSGGDIPSPNNFQKTYVFYQYPQYPADRPIPATDLNDFGIFVYLGVNHADLCIDSSKKVQLRKWYNASEIIREGHFELDSSFTVNEPGTKAYKIVWDPAIVAVDIPFVTECGIIIPEASFGDEKFGQWLNDHESVAEKDCRVNATYARFIIVDNNATGITTINTETLSPVIFDLQGRRVQNMDKKGVYIVNGRKVVIK